MFKQIIPILLLLTSTFALHAQGEIEATVRISSPQLQQADRKVFDQLEVALREFLNNTKWTKDRFEPDERIKCNFIFTISEELGNNSYRTELAIQAVRPIYGSDFRSPLISHLDKDCVFSYQQDQPIEFLLDAADNQNLPTILAFYVYIILGMDYDSFSSYGGEPYYLTAQQIVTNAQGGGNAAAGWRPADGGKNRNRYWVIENLLNPRVKPYRSAMYTYYRQGLDNFSTNVDQGKVAILQALEEVDKVNVAYFNSMIVQMFANAKKDELVEMWKVGTKPQKDRVIQIMSKIDPANGQRYREIGF